MSIIAFMTHYWVRTRQCQKVSRYMLTGSSYSPIVFTAVYHGDSIHVAFEWISPRIDLSWNPWMKMLPNWSPIESGWEHPVWKYTVLSKSEGSMVLPAIASSTTIPDWDPIYTVIAAGSIVGVPKITTVSPMSTLCATVSTCALFPRCTTMVTGSELLVFPRTSTSTALCKYRLSCAPMYVTSSCLIGTYVIELQIKQEVAGKPFTENLLLNVTKPMQICKINVRNEAPIIRPAQNHVQVIDQ